MLYYYCIPTLKLPFLNNISWFKRVFINCNSFQNTNLQFRSSAHLIVKQYFLVIINIKYSERVNLVIIMNRLRIILMVNILCFSLRNNIRRNIAIQRFNIDLT